MAERILRVEKLDEKERVLFIELQREARNGVMRIWNTFGVSGLHVSHKERENFQDEKGVETYVRNAKKQYIAQGFKEIKAVKAAPSAVPVAAAESVVLE